MPFQENYGVQTIYQVPKPSFRAFELLYETGTDRVSVDWINNSTTATSGKNSKQILMIYPIYFP